MFGDLFRLRDTGRAGQRQWAISSAVEHLVDIEGVTSSILVSPTTFLFGLPASSASLAMRAPWGRAAPLPAQ